LTANPAPLVSAIATDIPLKATSHVEYYVGSAGQAAYLYRISSRDQDRKRDSAMSLYADQLTEWQTFEADIAGLNWLEATVNKLGV
jgi:hypothetical protein